MKWLKRIKRTLIEQQMVELQKIKGQNHFFSTAANQTLNTVNNLSDRLVRDESRFNGELSQLNGRTENLESRLDQLQSQLTDELHKRSVYDSSMSYINEYKSIFNKLQDEIRRLDETLNEILENQKARE